MLFCNEKWPPEKYNKALAELTEAKLERQLQEFLFEITGNEKFKIKKLELREEIHQGINFCRPAQTQQNDCIDIQ
jgi:hypothetical protein